MLCSSVASYPEPDYCISTHVAALPYKTSIGKTKGEMNWHNMGFKGTLQLNIGIQGVKQPADSLKHPYLQHAVFQLHD